jgi:hypothetical protein
LNKIKQELKRLNMGDICVNGGETNENVWREVIKAVWILRDRIWTQV